MSTKSKLQLRLSYRPLSVLDVASCWYVEERTFPPCERATLEKYAYRLQQCPDLCLGMFNEGGDLIGHISATRTTNPTVTEADMAIPSDEEELLDPGIGNKPEGRTVCIHSLGILPAYQRMGLGKKLMAEYLKALANSKVAERAALLAHDHLVPYYESFGFVNHGPSDNQFGEGGWNDMVFTFV